MDGPGQSKRSLLAAVFGKKASDPEYEMAINRVVIITTLFVFAKLFGYTDDSVVDFVNRLYVLYLCSAFAIFLHILLRPQLRRFRRVFSMLIDICALTYVSLYVGPSAVGFLYPAYLLIIYGYGFRYGVRWLAVSAGMSIIGVASVVAFSPAWQGQNMLGGGLLVGLVIIPAYALQLAKRLWEAKAQAEASSNAKSMFIAAVSHDLRTPLNAIIGLGDILAASKTSPDEADMARMISDAGRSLLGQIDSILDFSRLEVGRAPITMEQVDVIEILCRIRELLDVSAQAKGVRLRLQAVTHCPRLISSSPRHIKDALVNLVGNAIKFTSQGSVDIAVHAKAARNGKACLRFEVRDTGIGISAENQQRIFERFTQANDKIRDTYGGSGLGLAIVRQLVEALDGRIGVHSVVGQGSTFWFEIEADVIVPERDAAWTGGAIAFTSDLELLGRLEAIGTQVHAVAAVEVLERASCRVGAERPPTILLDAQMLGDDQALDAALDLIAERSARSGLVVVGGDESFRSRFAPLAGCVALLPASPSKDALADALYLASGAASQVSAPSPIIEANLPPVSILVAEDNKTNQKVIAKMLSLSGRQAMVVDNGEAALDALAKERFDIVLMDINMPVIDGVEATRILRQREARLGWRTPVIALTADVTPETRARCTAAGMDDCVTKPIDLPRLLETIERWTGHRPLSTVPRDEAATEPKVEASETAADDAPPDLNHAAIADLERLGGKEFVHEIVSQFVSDAALLLKSLAAAVEEKNIERFRDDAHALRSCSANVGARALYELCLSWRSISPHEFASEGVRHLARLEQEYARACAQLEPYLEQAA